MGKRCSSPEWGVQLGASLDNIHPLEKHCKTWCQLSSLLCWHCGRMPKGKEIECKTVLPVLRKGKECSYAPRRAAAQTWNLSLFHISHLLASLNILKHCSSEGEVHTQG